MYMTATITILGVFGVSTLGILLAHDLRLRDFLRHRAWFRARNNAVMGLVESWQSDLRLLVAQDMAQRTKRLKAAENQSEEELKEHGYQVEDDFPERLAYEEIAQQHPNTVASVISLLMKGLSVESMGTQ